MKENIGAFPSSEWFVLDGRALFVARNGFVAGDARCSVLEACGRKRPGVEGLSKAWGQQGAWLAKDAGQLGFELVQEIP